MNEDIEFRFVTRTLKEDYHVYADSGREVFSDEEEFAPLRRKCGIMSEGGGCAVLFEERGKIFLVGSGLSRDRRDISGRAISFSFCEIFRSAGRDERERSYASFSRLINEWRDVELRVQMLFREDDTVIYFDERRFMLWLEEERCNIMDFRMCKHGDVGRPGGFMWPMGGNMVKWVLSEPDEVFCMRLAF